MIDYQKLLSILDKELACHNRLLTVLADERNAIVSFDKGKVDEVAALKAEILAESQTLREKLLETIEADKNSPSADAKAETKSLRQAIEYCNSAKIKTVLAQKQTELKDLIVSAQAKSKHNFELIRQSLGFIASTLAIMRSAPEVELPVYGVNAKLSSESQDPAFAPHNKTLVRSA